MEPKPEQLKNLQNYLAVVTRLKTLIKSANSLIGYIACLESTQKLKEMQTSSVEIACTKFIKQ